jgi:hypothetical protein
MKSLLSLCSVEAAVLAATLNFAGGMPAATVIKAGTEFTARISSMHQRL